MVIKHIKAAASAASSILDVNGDGVVDHKDAIAAAKITGAAAVGAGATIAAGTLAGSAIVSTGAAAIAAKVTMISGAAAGAFIGATFGATTAVTTSIVSLGSVVFIGSSSITSISAPLLAAAASTGSWAAQAASGKIAGMALLQTKALSAAVTAGDVVVIAGLPIGVTAAVSAGLVAIVIVGAYAYYILTKDSVSKEELTGLIPNMA